MFDKLKNAFSSAAKSIGQKEITEKVLDDTLLDLQIALLESDVAQEVVDDLSAKLKKELLGLKLEKGQQAEQIIQSKLQNTVAEIFARAGRLNLVERIMEKKQAKAGPFVMVFLGINGTGKTTTVAKMANMLRKNGVSVVVAAGDTHRAGAIEQLTKHAERLSLKVIAQRYGADPSAVGRDAVEHAKKNYIDAVLIDTAGRMQTSKNLMDEMAKIVRVVKPDIKLFIGDALAGNDTINQAREFFQYTKFDGAILTKIDADAKGGSAISIAHITSKPISYIGIGQGYDDIIPFDPDKFIESLFGATPTVSVESLMSAPQKQSPESAKVHSEEPVKEVAHLPTLARPTEIFAADEEPKPEPKIEPIKSPPVTEIKDEPKRPMPPEPEMAVESEQVEGPKEKKNRFGGLFGRKKGEEAHRNEEHEKREKEAEGEKERKEHQEREKREQERKEREEREKKEKEKDKKKRKEDKDSAGQEEGEKVIYLTDDDIEDLLK